MDASRSRVPVVFTCPQSVKRYDDHHEVPAVDASGSTEEKSERVVSQDQMKAHRQIGFRLGKSLLSYQ
jgi:hypothetical protein